MKNKIPPENGAKNQQGEDASIEDTLSVLKELKIPSRLRASNKQRINEALAEERKRAEGSGFWWWCGRISVPVPMAAVILIAFCVLGFLQIRQINHPPATSTPSEHKSEKAGTTDDGSATIGKSRKAYYYEKALYVLRVGFINREHGYQFLEENNYENNQ